LRGAWPAIGLLAVAALLAGVALRDQPVDDERRVRGTEDRTGSAGALVRPSTEPGPYTVRRRGGVPPDWTRRARGAPGVTAVARIGRTQMLLTRSTSGAGRVVDAPPRGYGIPLDALVVRPAAYAAVLPPDAGAAARALRPGTALLTRTSARVRRLDTGDRLELATGRALRVAGVVADHLALDAELALRPGDAGGAPASNQRLLVATTRPRDLASAMPDRASRIAPVQRAGDDRRGGIVRALDVKARFGEFAVRLPYGEDWIELDPRWVREHIVTRPVPILGAVTCHRAMFEPLGRALGRLERQGLSHAVSAADYAGCYAPRRIPGSGSLSLHAWGLAIDLNAAANPRLGPSRQDPRLVRAMERAAFTWGGRWPTAPDPMHFELHDHARSG
jgi:D-alanyl-D-alanine carboxypeptidase